MQRPWRLNHTWSELGVARRLAGTEQVREAGVAGAEVRGVEGRGMGETSQALHGLAFALK